MCIGLQEVLLVVGVVEVLLVVEVLPTVDEVLVGARKLCQLACHILEHQLKNLPAALTVDDVVLTTDDGDDKVDDEDVAMKVSIRIQGLR